MPSHPKRWLGIFLSLTRKCIGMEAPASMLSHGKLCVARRKMQIAPFEKNCYTKYGSAWTHYFKENVAVW